VTAEAKPPRVVVLAGPNGAGKSTTAQRLVRDLLGIRNFVNADTIARGLAAAAAVVRAANELRRRNALLGLPLVIWRDGRVQHVDATTLEPIVWPAGVREGAPLPPPQC